MCTSDHKAQYLIQNNSVSLRPLQEKRFQISYVIYSRAYFDLVWLKIKTFTFNKNNTTELFK